MKAAEKSNSKKPSVKSQNIQLILGVFIAALILSFALIYSLTSHKSANKNSKCSVAVCVALTAQAKDAPVYTIKTGSYVQFNSADGKSHQVELVHSAVQHTDPSRYESGKFGADEGWKVQFKQDGTYVFADKSNPDNEITIIAYTSGKDYKVN